MNWRYDNMVKMPPPQPEPFNVTTLEPEPLALQYNGPEPHDPFGKRTGSGGIRRGTLDPLHSQSSMPRPPDNQPVDPTEDPINPSHYRRHPSGIECIDVTRHMTFNTGNAIKYIWRYLDKGDPVENLKKAQWYLDDEIRRLEGKR